MIPRQKITHLINGQNLGQPRNWPDLSVKIDFLNKQETVDLSVTDLEFVLKANKYLQERALNGLDGGVGIFEGEPHQIKLGEESNPVYTFDGYLDFTDGTTFLGKEEFICSLKKTYGNDWLTDKADGYSYAYLADEGIITSSDYVKVPYIINYIPDGLHLMILTMSSFMMLKELAENIQSLAEAIGDVVNASTPVVGVGVGVGAVAVTAWDLGDFILITIKIIARIAYLIGIVIAIKSLIDEIFAQMFPKQREHLGMTFRTILEKGCEKLGLKFESEIPELEWVHIPIKDKKGGESGEAGHPLSTGPIGTLGDAIRVLSPMFNADYIIIDKVFHFNRIDNFEKNSTFVVPDFFNDQERLLNTFKLNTNEIVANYNINWAYDTQDQNTLDNQEGRVFQAITSPVSVINSELVNIKNLAQINIPFSLGRTKTELTFLEKTAKELGGLVDSLTGIFGNGTNFSSQIKNRVGSLLMSSDFLTIGKVVKMSKGKLTKDQRGDLAATKLWENYHFINSFAEINGNHNQYFRFENITIPMSLKDFGNILDNNRVLMTSGEEAEIEYLDFKPQQGKAEINIRVKRKYTNNLKIEYVT